MQRSLVSCCVAELIGTFILVFLGCGAVHVAVLTGELSGLWQVGMVWGVGVMGAAYACGAVSGAHINPAITVGLAAWRHFPLSRVGPYIASQVGGAFLAAAALFFIFSPTIKVKDNALQLLHAEATSSGTLSVRTAMCYGEYYPNPALNKGLIDVPSSTVTEGMAFFAEVLCTAILAIVVAAVADDRNPVTPRQMAPLFIGLTVAALISVIAPLTQACLNPARDFGPRLFAYFAGWGEVAIPGPNGRGFFTVYILAPLLGGVVGIGTYYKLLRAGPTSVDA
jgi:glycerol uptake facilitator protein